VSEPTNSTPTYINGSTYGKQPKCGSSKLIKVLIKEISRAYYILSPKPESHHIRMDIYSKNTKSKSIKDAKIN